jgi:uncharacterized hydrophobic protein (TIGR00271 family)
MPSPGYFKKYFSGLFHIPREEEEHQTLHEIIEGTRFRGHNFWIMAFAMIIACVGLNNDSLSAVIGAMLISPLMGPVTAIAFSLVIRNSSLLKTAAYNWVLMTLVCLTASVIFFLLSPFNELTTQLQSFSHPTIFDVLLAFFGGLAGFLGISRKDGTKVIAGVAVATACMPPLCTAGYGIVNGELKIFTGGIYFYCINSLFIGIATFVTARLLNYHQSFSSKGHLPGKYPFLWALVIIAVTIPALYIGYIKWKRQQFHYRADNFITVLEEKIPGLVVLKDQTAYKADVKKLEITVANDSVLINDKIKLLAEEQSFSVRVKYQYTQAATYEDLNKRILLLEKQALAQDSLLRQLKK